MDEQTPLEKFVMGRCIEKEEVDGYAHAAHDCDAGCMVCAEIRFLKG